MDTPPPGRRALHRLSWLLLYPLLAWGLGAFLFFEFHRQKELQFAVFAMLTIFPLALYFRWSEADAYRARSYCYGLAIALGGVGLVAGYLFLLFQGVGPASSWR